MLRGLFVLCVLLQFIPGCMRRMPDNTPKAVLRLATTTSTNDSGLLERLQTDLDWVVLKALEKDPDFRYRSAKEFAEDWYLTPRGKDRAGELLNERTFAQAAERV